MNSFFNKIYKALPTGWRTIIKEVMIKTITGYNNEGRDAIITSTMNKIYLPALAEVDGSQHTNDLLSKELQNEDYIISTL